MTNFLLSIAAIVTVTVTFLVLVKRYDKPKEYEIDTNCTERRKADEQNFQR